MLLNLGLQVDEEMKKQITSDSSKTVRRMDFCTSSFNGCLCKNICHCISSDLTRENFKYLVSEKSNKDDQTEDFDITETEENLFKILRLEQSTNDVATENENLKKFLEYMESNYRNQYEMQRLVIEDLKIQIEDLLSQLKTAFNNIDIKNAENDDMLKSLGQRKRDYEEVYMKLRTIEIELENQKTTKMEEAQSMDYLKAKINKQAKKISEMKEQLEKKDKTHQEVMSKTKNQLNEKHSENLDLKNVVISHEDSIQDLQRQMDDLMDQLDAKDAEIERLKTNQRNETGKVDNQSQIKALEQEIDSLRAELKKKNSENQKLKNALSENQEQLKQIAIDLDTEILNHENTKDEVVAHSSNLIKLQNIIKDHEMTHEEKDNIISDLNDQLDKANKGKKNAENELAQTRTDMNALNDEIQKLKDDLINKKSNNSSLNNLMNENDALKNAVDDLKSRIAKLEDENDEKVRTANDLDNDNKNLKNQITSLNSKLKEVTLMKENLKSQMDKSVMASTLGSKTLQSQILDKDKQMAALKDQVNDLKNQLREALGKLDSANEEVRNLKGETTILKKQLLDSDKVIDNLNKEKLQLNKNLKTSKDALDQKIHDFDVLKKQFDDKNNELNALKDLLNATQKERDQLKDEKGKIGEDQKDALNNNEKLKLAGNKIQQDLENCKLALAQERDNKNKKIEDLTNELEKIKADTTTKDSMEQLKLSYKELQIEMEKKTTEVITSKNVLTNQDNKIKDLQNQISNLEKNLKQMTDNHDDLKKEVENLYTGLTEVLRQVWQAKVITYELNTLLTDDETDLKKQEKLISTAKREQFLPMTLELLNDIKKAEKENISEVHDIKTALKNIAREKTSLLEQKQQLENQVNDLRKRHDDKTDIVGKMAVKLFVLYSEIERIQGQSKK